MKTAMIWGAEGGIGQVLVRLLQENDWQVIALSRRIEELLDNDVLAVEVDVSKAHSVHDAVLSASYEIEAVDLWVYAMGDIVSARLDQLSPKTWRRILAANLDGAYLATHFSLPLLAEDSHLFFLGAVSERLRLPGLAAYASAKAGLEAFVEALAKEQRKRRVTIVRPGAVDTPFWDKVPLRLPKDAASPEKVAQRILAAYDQGDAGKLDLI